MPDQPRVVRPVVDDEPGVEPEPVVEDRVRVAARPVVPLEQFHVVDARQRVRGPEARDAANPYRALLEAVMSRQARPW